MEDCIFCKIVTGSIPSATVYEDDATKAFMTVEAINEGHVLVIPKEHVAHVDELEPELFLKVMATSKKMMDAVKSSYQPKKVGLLVSGLEVPHAHVHIVPMVNEADVTSKKWLEKTTTAFSIDERIAQALKISAQL